MKKKFTFLMAALMLMITSLAWGQTRDEEVYSTCLFGSSYNSQEISNYTSTWTATNGSFSWTIENANNNNNGWSYIKFGRKNNASVGSITTASAYSDAITKVELTIDAITAAKINSIKLYSSSNNSSWTEIDEFDKSTGTQTVSIASSAANLYYKIEFDCASGSSNGLVTVSKVEYYKEAEAPAYTITAQSNNTSLGTVSLAGTVITGTPAANCRYASPAYTVDPENSATVVQDNENINKFTVTPTANTTVTINFEAIPQYAVTFSVNGATSSQNYYEGATITFPAKPENIYGKTFVGWTTSAIEGTTNTPPTFVNTSVAITCTAAVTYYAVFADMTGSSSPTLTKMTSEDTFAANDKVVIVADGNVAMYQETTNTSYVNKWSFENNAATVVADNKKWLTVSSGSLTGTWILGDATNGYVYNGSNNNLAINTNNSTDFTLEWNNKESKFTLVGNSRWLSYRSDLDNKYFRMGGATTGDPSGVVYFDIYKFSTGSVSYINYCTTVTAPVVEIPEIAIGENPFLFSTTVTITCGTEGSSIKYRYNENDSWSDYTAALTITETKTIYAKGVKGDDESTVAQATATKNLANPTVTVSGDLIVDLDGETNVNAGTLSATVTYNDEAVAGATVTWGSNHPEIATIDASTGAVTLLATGEVTFTATYAGNGDYSGASGTKTVTVVNSKAPGTEGNPYTVAQAKANTPSSGTSSNVYIHGIVSKFEKANIINDGSNYRYYISDDGTTANQLLVYKGKGLNNVTFSNADDLLVGDIVTIYGGLTTYNSTKEIASGNYLISVVRPGTGSDPATIAGTVVDFTIADDENYIVASNTTLTVTGTLTNNGTAANLIIEEGGQIILPEDASVSATIKRSVKGNAKAAEWEAFASTINNPAIESTNLITGTYDLYMYDEAATGAEWRNYKANTGAFANLANSRGYLYRNAATMDITITGSLNTSDISTYTLSRNSGDANIIGFNFVGNPYQMEIYKGVAISNEYLETGYYVLENGGWAVKDDNVAIAPGAGILIQAKDGGHNQALDITYTGASAKANHDNIMFTVKNSEYSDVSYAMFDKGHGLNKIEHRNANIPMLYIPQNGERFAIAMMDDNTQMFDLSFKAMTTGKYTISINAKGNFSYIHLIDRLTGDDTNLLIEDYSFVGSPKDNAERFIVKLSYDNDSSTGSETFAYQSGNEIIVNGEGALEVYDVTGRKVMTTTINGVETINGLNSGVYIFRVFGETQRTQKIVVR